MSGKKPYPNVDNKVHFPALEEDILRYWNENRIFERSVENRPAENEFVFYDGPPFATGLPHYGHILTSYIKDTIPRYFTMQGFRVERRFGWDCHGLPVEVEVEKELGISGKLEIEQYGIESFISQCRSIVTRYTKEWRAIVTRLGRWVDFNNEYRTMDLPYMESVLHSFKRLSELGLLYEGEKVVTFCYRCQTALSNFEARLDDAYRPRMDPSITVVFRSAEDPDTFFLVWTTTPWTLPSNIALAVGPHIEYGLYKLRDGRKVWLAEDLASAYAAELDGSERVALCKGSDLVGHRIEPLLPYFSDWKGFRILPADFVETGEGTGIVHIAPSFGEEDLVLGTAHGIAGPNPVDEKGCFTAEVTDFAGMNVHDANDPIMRHLEQQGVLVKAESAEHFYPHCWRCDTPLIYKAISTWYIRVSEFKDRLLEANQKIRWVPEHIRDGRFGKWLEGARDWAVSRNRFWGAPIPIWRCESCGEHRIVGSIKEISELSGKQVTDLHRPAIDEHTFTCECGGVQRRIPDVLDCWFESGSMPYAQVHYPFEHEKWFKKNFPADFIVEYIAQTRGWFYTLVVLAAALFDSPPFLNCICHGVILSEDGRKMSKRLKNYPAPEELVDRFGSDALRIALLSSPVVRGVDIRFAEADVRDMVRRFLIPLWNSYYFFTVYANIDEYRPAGPPKPAMPLDYHILAVLQEFKRSVAETTERYDIVKAYEHIEQFIDVLNNWYIRLCRQRFWASGMSDDKEAAYSVLHHVLVQLCKVTAPFIPFLAETIFRGLTPSDSVHLEDWPAVDEAFVDTAIVEQMGAIRRVIELGRAIRERNRVRIRQPLQTIGVVGVDEQLLAQHAELIQVQLNVKEIRFHETKEKVAKPAFRAVANIMGPRHGKDTSSIIQRMKAGEGELKEDGRLQVGPHVLDKDEFIVTLRAAEKNHDCESDRDLVVDLDLTVTDELRLEGLARDINRALQSLRKDAELAYDQRIIVGYEANDEMAKALQMHSEWLAEQGLVVEWQQGLIAGAPNSVFKAEGSGEIKLSLRSV